VKREIVHMLDGVDGHRLLPYPSQLQTSCGRTIVQPIVYGGPSRYEIIALNGNQFFGTTDKRFVTCVKCKKVIRGPK
jgi:hypothetical protein